VGYFNGPVFELDCFDNDCSGNNGPKDVFQYIQIALFRTAALTWQLTVQPAQLATLSPPTGIFVPSIFYYDSTFTWSNVCSGGQGSGTNSLTACTNTNVGGGGSCAQPQAIGHGGTHTAR
jgi:hypothetical protein